MQAHDVTALDAQDVERDEHQRRGRAPHQDALAELWEVGLPVRIEGDELAVENGAYWEVDKELDLWRHVPAPAAADTERDFGRDDRPKPSHFTSYEKSPLVGNRPERASMGSGRPLHDATAAARSYGTSQVHMKRGDYWKPGRFVQRAGCGLARRTTASGFVAHVVEGEQNRAGTPGSPGRESLKAAGVPLLFRARCEQ
jgi:hypothetical protein